MRWWEVKGVLLSMFVLWLYLDISYFWSLMNTVWYMLFVGHLALFKIVFLCFHPLFLTSSTSSAQHHICAILFSYLVLSSIFLLCFSGLILQLFMLSALWIILLASFSPQFYILGLYESVAQTDPPDSCLQSGLLLHSSFPCHCIAVESVTIIIVCDNHQSVCHLIDNNAHHCQFHCDCC